MLLGFAVAVVGADDALDERVADDVDVFKVAEANAFYTVKDGDAVVVAVEYATRDYVDRITKRTAGAT